MQVPGSFNTDYSDTRKKPVLAASGLASVLSRSLNFQKNPRQPSPSTFKLGNATSGHDACATICLDPGRPTQVVGGFGPHRQLNCTQIRDVGFMQASGAEDMLDCRAAEAPTKQQSSKASLPVWEKKSCARAGRPRYAKASVRSCLAVVPKDPPQDCMFGPGPQIHRLQEVHTKYTAPKHSGAYGRAPWPRRVIQDLVGEVAFAEIPSCFEQCMKLWWSMQSNGDFRLALLFKIPPCF